MARFHLVRVGAMSAVGRFSAVDGTRYPRGAHVIVRTDRGLETGEVLAPPATDEPRRAGQGVLLRGMTAEDHLLAARLQKNRTAAHEACQRRLDETGLGAVLLDVEHLFDGRTLVFHFLGEVSPAVEALTAELAEVYDSQAQFRAFSDTLAAGCGPDCGTGEAGSGCTTCATGCAVASVCHTRRA